MAKAQKRQDWTGLLDEEDLAFIKRFVLASGSLKALAEAYGISYPTVRLRLDRLIEKIKIADSREVGDEFERLARMLFAEGKLDAGALRALMAAHREQMEKGVEEADRTGERVPADVALPRRAGGKRAKRQRAVRANRPDYR